MRISKGFPLPLYQISVLSKVKARPLPTRHMPRYSAIHFFCTPLRVGLMCDLKTLFMPLMYAPPISTVFQMLLTSEVLLSFPLWSGCLDLRWSMVISLPVRAFSPRASFRIILTSAFRWLSDGFSPSISGLLQLPAHSLCLWVRFFFARALKRYLLLVHPEQEAILRDLRKRFLSWSFLHVSTISYFEEQVIRSVFSWSGLQGFRLSGCQIRL